MRSIFALALWMAFATSAVAADETVVYMGGTVLGLQPEATGRLDASDANALIFENKSSKTAIPFSGIISYEYSHELTHHLGVLPTIAVGLVRVRKHQHFVRIEWRDANDAPQVAVFRVPKQMPKSLVPILRARAPKACGLGGPRPRARDPRKETP